MAKSRHYQPAIIRAPSLIGLVIASLVLIILTEVAIRRLPAHNPAGLISSVTNADPRQIERLIAKRIKRQAYVSSQANAVEGSSANNEADSGNDVLSDASVSEYDGSVPTEAKGVLEAIPSTVEAAATSTIGSAQQAPQPNPEVASDPTIESEPTNIVYKSIQLSPTTHA